VERLAIDLLAPELYAGDPYPVYAWMRANEPVYWDEVNELWGVARYDDIVEIEKRKDVFINSDTTKGGYRPNLPADAAIIGLDDPMHSKRRNLVSRRFTPKAASAWEDDIRAKVNALIDGARDSQRANGAVEIVPELAAPLPAMMIGKLLGFDEADWPKLKHWSETTIAMGGGPRYFSEVGMISAMEFAQAAADLFEAKKSCPADDIYSHYTTVEIDGCPFDQDAAIADGLLLLDGGAETTRTVIAHGLHLFSQHPEEWERLAADPELVATGVEELIRWVTPLNNFFRTAVADARIGDQPVAEGDRIILLYPSANRDSDVFADPFTFDVTRSPNPHVSFGYGTHFCIGANLARYELRMLFGELTRRFEPPVALSECEVEPNIFARSVASFRCSLTPR